MKATRLALGVLLAGMASGCLGEVGEGSLPVEYTLGESPAPEAFPGETGTPGRMTMLVHGKRTELNYVEIRGVRVHGGDIILPKEAALEEGTRSVQGVTVYDKSKWPNAIIPYEAPGVNPLVDFQVSQAMKTWESMTVIRFVPHTTEEDYVVFTPSDSGHAWSYVGRIGGRQEIGIPALRDIGTITHEIGHTIGLHHEHERTDRDQYVKILWENIDPAVMSNFEQFPEEQIIETEYDYDSLMHYFSWAQTKNGYPTIIRRDFWTLILPKMTPSALDAKAVNALYSRP